MGLYSKADQGIKGNNSGKFTGGPPKGVLHTTEGSSASGAIAAFKANNSWSHFLVHTDGKIWQFINTNVAARTLRNALGGVQTNTDWAIQIEIVGFAAKIGLMPTAQHKALYDLMRWIETDSGVLPVAPPLPFASRYGQPGTRLSSAVWDAYGGWCGHSHVPEGNDHWDPGKIDLLSLLPPKDVKPMYEPPLNLEPIAASVKLADGRVYLGAVSGAIYGFEVPPIRGANGQAYFVGRKAAKLFRSEDAPAPDGIDKTPGGVTIQTTDGAWYGPYRASP